VSGFQDKGITAQDLKQDIFLIKIPNPQFQIRIRMNPQSAI
jgi:hypothetical protein